jgi:hypothetical protein
VRHACDKVEPTGNVPIVAMDAWEIALYEQAGLMLISGPYVPDRGDVRPDDQGRRRTRLVAPRAARQVWLPQATDLSMDLSMKTRQIMPEMAAMTAGWSDCHAEDRPVHAERATCKAVVRGSSPLTGSLNWGYAPRVMNFRGSTHP